MSVIIYFFQTNKQKKEQMQEYTVLWKDHEQERKKEISFQNACGSVSPLRLHKYKFRIYELIWNSCICILLENFDSTIFNNLY